MARSWAARFLVPVAAVLFLGCTEVTTPAGEPPSPGGAEGVAAAQGWMGRFSRRDPALAALLQGQPGWNGFRDMELFEAIQAFAGSDKPVDRLGAARSYLCLADLFASLDALFLEVEAEYLADLGPAAGAPERVRQAFVGLRRGEFDRVRPEFEAAPPEKEVFAWALGRAGLAAVEGRQEDAKDLARRLPEPADDRERVLGEVARFLWGIPWEGGGKGPYGQAIAAFRRGDLTSGVMALQMLDFRSGGAGADPGLFLYPLLRRAFAGLAVAALGEPTDAEGAFLAGRAREHLGEWGEAARWFGKAVSASGSGAVAAWLFSPYHGPADAARVARVLQGGALYRSGRAADALGPWREVVAQDSGPLALAWLAALQAELATPEPLGNPENAAAAAVASVGAAPEGFTGDGAAALSAVYAARTAAVSRLAARVYRRRGDRKRAADVLDRAHSKAAGYRPDFATPPGYLVDLAREYAASGEYAPAVAVMFELVGDYPSARLGYESLKRMYASRTGGEAPPR